MENEPVTQRPSQYSLRALFAVVFTVALILGLVEQLFDGLSFFTNTWIMVGVFVFIFGVRIALDEIHQNDAKQ